jgi:serine/threonine protein kinase
MKPERWQQIDKLFQAALVLDAQDRASFLDHACKGDAALRREVESLIASHDSAGSFMSSPAIEANPSLVASDTSDSMLQKQVGPYLIISLIGAGGMGEVYLAQDTRLGRKVAIKMLPDHFTRDHQRVGRFKQEARTASGLNHPNIITIYDIGQAGGRHYIAMEHVEGETLRGKIHRDKAPIEKLLKYLHQVAEGLTRAHAVGIVHRDLKPDNIMITRDGYAKVLDFGLAKLIERPDQVSAGDGAASEAGTALIEQHSMPGMVMGTAGYMSPEQAQGRVKEIDHRSDIFSFGCILFEAATGQRAFEGKDVLDSLHRIVHAAPPQVKEINPHAPDDLERIVRRCLAKDPDKRYHSIKDVAIELEDLLQDLKGKAGVELTASTESSRQRSGTVATGEQSAASNTRSAEVTGRQTSSAEYLLGQVKRHKVAAMLIGAFIIVA